MVTTPELKIEEEMSTTTEIQMEHCKCKVLSLLCKAKFTSLARFQKILPMLHLFQVHQFCHFYWISKLKKQIVCINELCDSQNSATFAPNQTQLLTQCMHTNTDLTNHKKKRFHLKAILQETNSSSGTDRTQLCSLVVKRGFNSYCSGSVGHC